jgi:acid phosphatase type 7
MRQVIGGSLLVSLICFATCSRKQNPTEPSTVVQAPVGALESAVLVGAGDIAVCGFSNAERTAAILDGIDGTVFLAGDNAYPDGTLKQYEECYGPTWGRHKSRTKPSPGNHDYNTPGAAGYFAYFGDLAGPQGRGYYSYRLGAWQVLSLNSNVPASRGSAQYEWLRGELSSDRSTCRLAYFHHPVFNSGFDGNIDRMKHVVELLEEYRTEVVVAGHAHNYERFAPQNSRGEPSAVGIRHFTVGTGGSAFTPLLRSQPNSEIFNGDTIGVIKFILNPNSYSWEFIPAVGWNFRDSGAASCF